MKLLTAILCLLLPLALLAILFSSCSYLQFVNKNLETPTSTVTHTFTYTETPTETPTPEPAEKGEGEGAGGGQAALTDGAQGAAVGGGVKIGGEVTEVLLWGFNVLDTQHWKGKVSFSDQHPAEGKGCLRIETTGCKGACQDLAWTDPARLGYYAELSRFKKISVDVFVPKGALGSNQQVQFDLVTSGPNSNWAVHKGYLLQEGHNHIEYQIQGNEIKDAWKFYFVVNAGESLEGPVFVDNIMGKL